MAQRTEEPHSALGESEPTGTVERLESGRYRLRSRLWITGGGETFLGYGRVLLLERIREFGSITKAAASMEMSYRHAWELVASMNRHAAKPVVTSTVGGKDGGGAMVTPEGERMIRVFKVLLERSQCFLDDLQDEAQALLAGEEPAA